MLVLIDNYDSFTYNLVHFLGELGADLEVVRNDVATVDELLGRGYERVVVSPGPCTPNEAGICLELIEKAGPTVPLLGVCLGHQAIGQVYGGVVKRAPVLMHGDLIVTAKTSDGLIMGLQHKTHPVHGVQFHPESIASEHGHALLANFLELAGISPRRPNARPSRHAA